MAQRHNIWVAKVSAKRDINMFLVNYQSGNRFVVWLRDARRCSLFRSIRSTDTIKREWRSIFGLDAFRGEIVSHFGQFLICCFIIIFHPVERFLKRGEWAPAMSLLKWTYKYNNVVLDVEYSFTVYGEAFMGNVLVFRPNYFCAVVGKYLGLYLQYADDSTSGIAWHGIWRKAYESFVPSLPR